MIENTEPESFIDPKKTDSLFKGEDKLSPYPTSISSPIIKPEDKRLIKGSALESMQRNAEQQIEMLRKQADLIMQQAKAIEKRIEISKRIYQAEFGFVPVAGGLYHLYQKENKEILSLIGPHEWGTNFPYDKWIATVMLNGDKTWEILTSPPAPLLGERGAIST